MDDLCFLSAEEALERFRARELSPLELLEAQIERIEAAEPVINAVMGRRLEDARVEAMASEQRYADGTARALDGLPIAIKDEMDIEGQPMTNGSVFLADNVSTETEVGVERLIAAGAVVHVRTTTPEFSAAGICWSDLHGVTRNPWNPAITPGGSSGGSAAAVAAGEAVMASGSDIGGSIRIPSSMCGLAGFKPPKGRVPTGSEWTYELYNHDHGPIARSVRDAVLYQNVIAGPSPRDPYALPEAAPLSLVPTDLRGTHIALSMDLGYKAVEPDVRREVEAAAARLRDAGATVEEVDLGWDERIDDAMMRHFALGMDLTMREEYGTEALLERASAPVRWNLSTAPTIEPADDLREKRVRYGMSQDLARVHADHDALLVPTVASTRMPADFNPWEGPFAVDGEALEDPILGWTMTVAFNMLSSCPVWTVPAGLADNGVPVGLQFVGRPFDDATATGIALAWDAIRPDIGRPTLP